MKIENKLISRVIMVWLELADSLVTMTPKKCASAEKLLVGEDVRSSSASLLGAGGIHTAHRVVSSMTNRSTLSHSCRHSLRQ